MDPDKVKGNIQRPYNTPEKKPADQVDPEKFKKVMKVDESDESQKRKKRNLKKEEEEGADEDVKNKTAPPNPVTSFSEFMSDKEELDNVFDKESGGIRRQAAPKAGTDFTVPPPEFIATEGEDFDQESEPPPTSPNYSSEPPPPPQQDGTQPPPSTPPQQPSTSNEYQQPSASSSAQPPPFFSEELDEPSLQQPFQEEQPPQPHTNPTQTSPTKQVQKGDKKEKKDTSLLSTQPKTKALKALKKKVPKGTSPKVKIVSKDAPSVKKSKPSKKKVIGKTPQTLEEDTLSSQTAKKEPSMPKAGEDVPGTVETAKPSTKKDPLEEAGAFSASTGSATKKMEKPSGPFKRFSSEEALKKKMGTSGQATEIEGLPVPSSSEGEARGNEKKNDEGFFLEADSQTAGIPLPSFETPIPAIVPPTDIPAYSKLSPEIHELFAKIGGVMIIQQEKGITSTTMNINMPGSVFNGTQVILNQYSTAPNSFNIQLVGNPDSVKVFNRNLDALKESFKQANFNFETNILNPILNTKKKSPHLIRRAQNAGDQNGKGGKQNQ